MKTTLRRLGVILLTAFVAVSVTTCGGGGGGGGGTSETQNVDVTGTWSGSWVSSGGGYSGNVTITLVQNGTSLSGTASVTGSPCLTSGSVSGTVSGNKVAYGVVSGQSTIEFNTTYASDTISGTYSITAGNCAGEAGTCSITRIAASDTTPPSVISTSPANIAESVSIYTPINAAFSETMNASSINLTTFTVRQGTTSVLGTVSYSGTTATFTPASPLEYSTTYTATITTGVKDLAGNPMVANYTWTFSTEAAQAAIDLTGTGNGSWASSGGVYSGSLSVVLVQNGSSITGTASITGSPCMSSGSVSGIVTGNDIVFGAGSGLDDIEFNATYVSQSISGSYSITAGSCAGDTGTFLMSKGATADTTPPTVTSTSPANNAMGVTVNATITAAFSEPVTGINTTTFTMKDSGSNPVPGAVTYSGAMATFTPASPLAYNTAYTAAITTGVKDLAGNPMVANYAWTFITEQGVSYNGTWQGTTSQGKNISFTVQNSGITSITVGYKIEGDYCTVEGSITTNFAIAQPITGNSFSIIKTGSGPIALSYTVQGTFTSSTAASGDLDFTYKQSYPNPSCNGNASATWSATK